MAHLKDCRISRAHGVASGIFQPRWRATGYQLITLSRTSDLDIFGPSHHLTICGECCMAMGTWMIIPIRASLVGHNPLPLWACQWEIHPEIGDSPASHVARAQLVRICSVGNSMNIRSSKDHMSTIGRSPFFQCNGSHVVSPSRSMHSTTK